MEYNDWDYQYEYEQAKRERYERRIEEQNFIRSRRSGKTLSTDTIVRKELGLPDIPKETE